MKTIIVFISVLFYASILTAENPLNFYLVMVDKTDPEELDDLKLDKKVVAGSIRTALPSLNGNYYEVFAQTDTDKQAKDWEKRVDKGKAIRINALWFDGHTEDGRIEKFNDLPLDFFIP